MHDPVVLSDGHTYERRHIERWLETHSTSPVSGVQLAQKIVFSNHALRNAIEEYFGQIFSVHRRAIRKTIHGRDSNLNLGSNASLLRTIDALMQCSVLLNADLDTERVLRQIMDEAKLLLGAEVASVFLVDEASQELYSTVNSTGGELRIPINAGIAGHVATSGELVVIQDAYHDKRFSKAVDVKTGFVTRNMICAPLKVRKGGVFGVVQIINKTSAGLLGADKGNTNSFGGVLDFTSEDLHFLQVFAAQAAAAAISNSSGYATGSESLQSFALEKAKSESWVRDTPCCSKSVACCFGKLLSGKEEEKKPQSFEDAKDDYAAALSKHHVDQILAGPAKELLADALDSWELNTLALAESTSNRPLSTLAVYLFDELGLVKHFAMQREKLITFLQLIEDGYDDRIPYHNRAHAASVLHITHAILRHTQVAQVAAAAFCEESEDQDGKLITMACLIAAAVHDFEHRGLSNDFLMKTRDERALLYNDHHVNENHHVAAAFGILYRQECNFLSGLPLADFRRVRNLVIDLVLGTDMASGNNILDSFKEALASFDLRMKSTESLESPTSFVPSKPQEAVLLLQVALKCADLGHLALGWDLHCLWVRRLETEFFAQGDKEKELEMPVSFLMDCKKPGVSETQVGFFNFVVFPLFGALQRAASGCQPLFETLRDNYQHWQRLEKTSKPEAEEKSEEKAGQDIRNRKSAAVAEVTQQLNAEP